MKINKNSWHYKLWRSSFDAYDVPTNTDLCRYCHRIFWRLVAWAMFFIMGGYVVFAATYGIFYKGLWQNTTLTLAIAGVVAALVGIIYLYNRWLNGNKGPQEPATLLGKYAHASKQKICPLVDFEK